jgi:hypothetical protein
LSSDGGSNITLPDLKEAFSTLLTDKMIERVPGASMPFKPHPPHEKTRPSKRSRQSTNIVMDPIESRQEQVLGAYQSQRYKLPADWYGAGEKSSPDDLGSVLPREREREREAHLPIAEEEKPTPSSSNNPPPPRGTKRTHATMAGKSLAGAGAGATTMGDSIPTIAAPTEVLFRVHNEQFIRAERIKCCIDTVQKLHGEASAVCMQALLQAARAIEKEIGDAFTDIVSLEDIEDTFTSMVQAGTIRRELAPLTSKVEEVLKALSESGEEFVTLDDREDVGGGGYKVKFYASMTRMVDFARSAALEDQVSIHFGDIGVRVYRILAMNGPSEQKSVADTAMVPIKEAREVRYVQYIFAYDAMNLRENISKQ